MAFRKPRPNNGGKRPLKSEVVYGQQSVMRRRPWRNYQLDGRMQSRMLAAEL
jgi:hypothetical protein